MCFSSITLIGVFFFFCFCLLERGLFEEKRWLTCCPPPSVSQVRRTVFSSSRYPTIHVKSVFLSLLSMFWSPNNNNKKGVFG